MKGPFLPQTIHFSSPVNGDILLTRWFGNQTLYVRGVAQSGGEYLKMWDNCLRKIALKGDKKCLVLGTGGGTVINVLMHYYPQVKVTAVELDPVMVDIAKNYFGLEHKKNIVYIVADAKEWVQTNRGKCDLVIVDIYNGRLNPSFCRKKEFLIKLNTLLSSSGTILFNAHYQPRKSSEFQSFLALCESVFRKTEDICSYRYNHVLLMN